MYVYTYIYIYIIYIYIYVYIYIYINVTPPHRAERAEARRLRRPRGLLIKSIILLNIIIV